ncbi:MAG: hypothetical protein JXB29_02240 [Sedimentisphaerales bacterium]|nr:hypothetical protein [Sedimentisphaerales bacterium]
MTKWGTRLLSLELAMGLIRRRARPLESAISICLLAILFLIGVGIFVKQLNYDMSRFGIETAVERKINNLKSEIETPFKLSSLPPPDFTILSEPKYYNADNLYEKINGKAPLYVESGFEKLTTAIFTYKEDENLWFELFLYEMGDIRNAFSVYSRQKRPDAQTLSNIRFSYKTANALYLVLGQYYIELIGSSQSAELFDAMMQVLKEIKETLPQEETIEIAELNLFPKATLVPDSFKLYLINAFGFEGLSNVYTARYQTDPGPITAFLTNCSNPNDAKETASKYRDFLIENEATTVKTNLKEYPFEVLDLYGSTELIFVSGQYVGGIHEAENQNAAEKLAIKMIDRLRQIISTKNND